MRNQTVMIAKWSLVPAAMLSACALAMPVLAAEDAKPNETNVTTSEQTAPSSDSDKKSKHLFSKIVEAQKKRDAGEKKGDDEKKADASEEADAEKSELDQMREEQQRLQQEYQLLQQRQKNELLRMELEQQRISTEESLRKAKLSAELSEMREQVDRIKTEAALKQAKLEQELAEAEQEMRRLMTMRQLEDARRSEEVDQLRIQAEKLSLQNRKMAEEVKQARLKAEKESAVYQSELGRLQNTLSVRQMRDEVNATVVDDMEYIDEPFQDGTLYISDRRISLNGPIMSGTADYVTERIHYFNNLSSELPIFIVIDSSPGGSVMEGYRIVKAIEASDAPIHVVVKSFAASMAAVITTLADNSYAYPNAVILHHQMSSGMSGNLTQQREQLENANEWAKRLAEPVARKMGVSLDRFVELMYENNSDGDWEEFADKAQKLHWVDHVVDEIREQGLRERPTSQRFSFFFMEAEERDADGERFVRLPRLQPFDYYFMYNPDGYYRYE